MPLFGVDDLLFILVSTSVLLWAKRGESVNQIPEKLKGELSSNSSDGSSGSVSDSYSSLEKSKNDYLRRSFSRTPLLLPGFNLSHPQDDPSARRKMMSTLIQHSCCVGAIVPEYIPAVPHRQYNMHKNIPQVSTLTSSTEREVADCIRRFTSSQISSLFQDMENEGLWESVLRVSKGISIANETMRYLPQANVERSIKTLINAHQIDRAVDYYFEYGVDVLISDELLVLLFDACRTSEERSMKLYKHLIPFKSRWNEVIYSCCITVTARWEHAEAICLYEAFRQFQRDEQAKEEKIITRFLSSSALLRESGVVQSKPMSKLKNLYHIMVPLVAEHYPEKLHGFISDMMTNEPEVAPDVFLKCLLCSKGMPLVEPIIRDYINRSDVMLNAPAMNVSQLAISLYHMQPSPMNMNTLLTVFIQMEKTKKLHLPSTTDRIPAPLIPLQKLFMQVPLETAHARVLSRTITEQKASWVITALFTSTMIQRQHFSVVPLLSKHLSRMGKWSAAATAMSIYMSNQRNRLSPGEVSMCIEASVRSGRWNSALFWVERASGAGCTLPSQVYDTALSTTKYISWDATVRLIHSIQKSGGTWTEKGYLQLVENSVRQGRMGDLLSVVQPQPQNGSMSPKK